MMDSDCLQRAAVRSDPGRDRGTARICLRVHKQPAGDEWLGGAAM